MNVRNLLLACLLVNLCGCIHVQLRRNAVNQAQSISDFHRQQVLNNLAMFAYDFNALPYFSFPNQTSAYIIDQGGAGGTAGWNRLSQGPLASGLLSGPLGLSFSGQRQAQEGFVVLPVNDPRKLELMRCAYQKALSGCGFGTMSTNCPDCKTRFNVFYTGEPDGDIRQKSNGAVTSECINADQHCWLCVGCKKCVPKHCPCMYVGHYCGTYVWVPPQGSDELTKLTLAILDFALHDQPQRLGKSVTYYVDELGLPTDRNKAVGTITAQIGVNERSESLLDLPREDEVRLLEQLEGQLSLVQQKLVDPAFREQWGGLLIQQDSLQKKVDYLNEQLRVGGLKEQFYPVGPAPGSSYPPLLNYQNLNALTPLGSSTGS
jgi:hypothetical protein